MNCDFEQCKEFMLKYLNENEKKFINMRRLFHQIPEESRKEFKTSELIQKYLNENNMDYRNCIGEKTGIVSLITGNEKGRTIAFRADLDGLPIKEETNLPYSSNNEGFMHACGHDFHISSVLGAGIILNKFRDFLPGNIKLIFQPAEEDGPLGGAKQMVKDGALDNPKVNSIYAMHVFPSIPKGFVAVLKGPAMASVDNFKVRIIGKGGHPAFPEDTIDPITIAGHVILTINSIISRKVSPMDNIVLSIGKIECAGRRNIIPNEVMLEGTMRTLSEINRKKFKRIVKQACELICVSHCGECDFKWFESYDCMINSGNSTNIVRETIQNYLGKEVFYENIKPFMTGEDFGCFLKKVNGSMFWVGCGTKESQILHNSKLIIDDDILLTGIKMFLGIAIEYFKKAYE